jgi:serralysin
MANYDFSTITPDQALAYNAPTDMLSTPIGDLIADFLVSFDDAAGTVRITDTDNPHAVVFGSGIYGELIFGPGGQAMHIGSPGPDLISFATVNFGGAGNDTESGGAGADIFHTSQGAGIDRVLDFNQAEGDRVMLDPGTTFTVSQIGDDTVVFMGGNDEIILVGVQAAALKPGWIFGF